MSQTDDTKESNGHSKKTEQRPSAPRLITVDEIRPSDDQGTCLRPLGLCELGGCCDTCWYSPDHPRHR